MWIFWPRWGVRRLVVPPPIFLCVPLTTAHAEFVDRFVRSLSLCARGPHHSPHGPLHGPRPMQNWIALSLCDCNLLQCCAIPDIVQHTGTGRQRRREPGTAAGAGCGGANPSARDRGDSFGRDAALQSPPWPGSESTARPSRTRPHQAVRGGRERGRPIVGVCFSFRGKCRCGVFRRDGCEGTSPLHSFGLQL